MKCAPVGAMAGDVGASQNRMDQVRRWRRMVFVVLGCAAVLVLLRSLDAEPRRLWAPFHESSEALLESGDPVTLFVPVDDYVYEEPVWAARVSRLEVFRGFRRFPEEWPIGVMRRLDGGIGGAWNRLLEAVTGPRQTTYAPTGARVDDKDGTTWIEYRTPEE